MDKLVVRLKRLSYQRQHRRLGSKAGQVLEPGPFGNFEKPLPVSVHIDASIEKPLSKGVSPITTRRRQDPKRQSKHHLDFALAFEPSSVTKASPPAECFVPRPASPNSQLERLPLEVQQAILLAIPDLSSLRALVHASPTLHSVYKNDRLRILRDCVDRSIKFDAHAAYLTGIETFRRSEIDQPMISQFLQDYKRSLSGGLAPSIANSAVRQDDYVQLARFHRSVVEPLTEQYAAAALAEFGSLAPGTQPLLRETERARIQHAIYRLETFCNLCSQRSPYPINDAGQRLEILSIFPAWQVEEILCINDFAKKSVEAIFRQVASDPDITLRPDGRSLVHDDGVPDKNMRNYILSRGMRNLLALLKCTETAALAQLLRASFEIDDVYLYHREDWLDSKPPPCTSGADEHHHTGSSEDTYFTVSSEAQDARRVEHVQEDCADGNEMRLEAYCTDEPPLAWVINRAGRRSDVFGDYVSAEFRQWGYVMWDAETLDDGLRERLRKNALEKGMED